MISGVVATPPTTLVPVVVTPTVPCNPRVLLVPLSETVTPPPTATLAPCGNTAALADVTVTRERTPAPSATTVASATRFVIVFVDMYFLSISRSSLS